MSLLNEDEIVDYLNGDMEVYRSTDLISRIFLKKRNGYKLPYKFQARAKIFDPPKVAPNLAKLCNYLQEVQLAGTQYMKDGCSNSDVIYELELDQIEESEVCELARGSKYEGTGVRMHPVVQKHFMYNDKRWIANEVPVFSETLNRSGFIDIVRYDEENDKIMICDFKPNAAKEKHKKVFTQLTHYSQLLSENTGIDIEDMHLMYFDSDNCYIVK